LDLCEVSLFQQKKYGLLLKQKTSTTIYDFYLNKSNE
jgi:hypothetical protein